MFFWSQLLECLYMPCHWGCFSTHLGMAWASHMHSHWHDYVYVCAHVCVCMCDVVPWVVWVVDLGGGEMAKLIKFTLWNCTSLAQIAGTRAEPQQIVAQRLLSCLQYPVPFKSSTKDLTWPTWTLFWHMMLTRRLLLYTNIGQGEYHRCQHGFWLRGVQPLSCRW